MEVRTENTAALGFFSFPYGEVGSIAFVCLYLMAGRALRVSYYNLAALPKYRLSHVI